MTSAFGVASMSFDKLLTIYLKDEATGSEMDGAKTR